jgi:hypothetical protein
MSIFTKSVDAIVADIQKKVQLLRDAAQDQTAQHNTKVIEAETVRREAQIALDNAGRADRIADRLEELLR